MNYKTNEFLENRIRWKFEGISPKACTLYWNELAEELREKHTEKVEYPVIYSAQDEQNYVILGTRELCATVGGETIKLNVENISKVDCLKTVTVLKHELPGELTIEMASGEIHNVLACKLGFGRIAASLCMLNRMLNKR